MAWAGREFSRKDNARMITALKRYTLFSCEIV
jgi:hypothetical protein